MTGRLLLVTFDFPNSRNTIGLVQVDALIADWSPRNAEEKYLLAGTATRLDSKHLPFSGRLLWLVQLLSLAGCGLQRLARRGHVCTNWLAAF